MARVNLFTKNAPTKNTDPYASSPSSDHHAFHPAVKQPHHPRQWVNIQTDGTASSMSLTKQQLLHVLGVNLQLRDLRILDPHPEGAGLYPAAVLVRERAMVVNLDYIKLIISLDHAYVTNLDDSRAERLVEELKKRLALQHASGATANSTGASMAGPAPFNVLGPSPLGLSPPPPPLSSARQSMYLPPTTIPFELRVLEVALDVISQSLEQELVDLDTAIHSALEAVVHKPSRSHLEGVRRVKNRLSRLINRAETLRLPLERLLDDTSSMRELNLSARENERIELMRRRSLRIPVPFDIPLSGSFPTNVDQLASQLSMTDALLGMAAPTPRTPGDTAQNMPSNTQQSPPLLLRQFSSLRHTRTTLGGASIQDDPTDRYKEDDEITVVSQLLESYYMRLNNVSSKLSTLADAVSDTEDFLNIELDSHRNEIIRLDLVLTAFTTAVAFITAVTSLFAMNMTLNPGNSTGPAPFSWFISISVSSTATAVVAFIGIISYCRWKRLL